MEREIDMNEVSDGRLYGLRDMVRADCGGCAGCSQCCESMGSTIILDPYDVWRLSRGMGRSFEQLLTDGKLELNVVEHIILPNMKTDGAGERCGFLSREGRCGIHPWRPGFCRIFPLGRYYENGGFRYFLQVHECPWEPKTKVRVQRWIDTPEARRNECFINEWHYFLKGLTARLEAGSQGSYARAVNLYLLKNFYQTPWKAEDEQQFYAEFDERLAEARKI